MKTTKPRKPRKLTMKQIDKVAREFDLAARLDRRLKAPDIAARVTEHASGPLFWYELETETAGRLRISLGQLTEYSERGGIRFLSADTIFCRFAEPARGVAVFGSTFAHGHVNPYSGKWNHHAFIGPCHGLTDPRDVLVSLQRCWWGFLDGLERLGFETDPESAA